MTTDASATMMAAEMHEEIGAGLREQVARLAVERGIDTEFLVVPADPVTELRRMAQEVRADALVVGASERAGHRFVGSLAGRLVKAARSGGEPRSCGRRSGEAGVFGVAQPCPSRAKTGS